MKKIVQLILFLLFTQAALAASPPDPIFAELRRQNDLLSSNVSTCKIEAQIVFQKLKNQKYDPKIEVSPDEQRRCAANGKEKVKNSFLALKNLAGVKKITSELLDWRIEWTAAFEATTLQDSDIERDYLKRVDDAIRAASKATNRLEIAFE